MRHSSLITSRQRTAGFTLVELLVSITVLVLLLGILFEITNTVSKTVSYTSSKIDAFAAGRAAFDLMNQKLSHATLNTYWDYDNPVAPTHYYRQSDLQFLVRQNVQQSGYGQEVYFPSPSTYSADSTIRSADGLLNACGFFVAYGPDTNFKPGTLAASTIHYRYRLIQGLEPTENLAIYSNWPVPPTATTATSAAATAAAAAWANYWTGTGAGTWPGYWAAHAWINTIANLGSGAPNVYDAPLANNVIALIVWPHLSAVEDSTGNKLTSNYTYDSQNLAMTLNASNVQPLTANQLPPTIQVTMILISESSAVRLCTSATPPTVIETALSGKFVVSTYAQYQADLNAVTSALATNHIACQILNTSVTMQESKWSDNSQ